jgi:two-component system response regulator FixJ
MRESPITLESPPTISVVDDDESIRDSTRALLRSAGYLVETFASAELFWDSGAPSETDCIVLDVRMPGMDGLELQRRLNGSRAGVPVVFLTAHDDARNRKTAMDSGAVDFLSKPFEANTLVSAVQAALARQAGNRPGRA